MVANYNRLRPQLATGGSIDLDKVSALKQKGFRTIVDLRTPEEGTAEEKAVVEAAGMRYINLPVSAGAPSDALIAELGEILADTSGAPVLLHCASGNRVGAVWAIYRVRKGAPLETALEEGRAAGMRSAREAQVRELLGTAD
ncbi:beta-lactamase hydrolase domain-containing protein [Microbulbifer pacificus]|uniref:beta-lactamase hydrolase domain-containing protein n=1 Tax=Microbulbifer pacificus TaxID=407164 RepID=UPI001319CDE2|nr:protein tyrosine phosphatase family protein [Microbulbifer pacificus]